MKFMWLNHTIEAAKLAGQGGYYYAFIDGMLDYEICCSRYPKIVIRRIKTFYAMQFIEERKYQHHKMPLA